MMDSGKIAYIFLQGLAFGYGPCLFSCMPVVMPYIASKKSWKEGLIAVMIFSFFRMLVYMLLGGMSVYAGAFLFNSIRTTGFDVLVRALLGILLMILGGVVMTGRGIKPRFCGIVEPNMAVLGILVGISPCLPLIGILLQIAVIADTFTKGVGYSFFFGLGTLLSPLLVLGIVFPLIGGRLNPRIHSIFIKICGFLMILSGFYILIMNRSGLKL